MLGMKSHVMLKDLPSFYVLESKHMCNARHGYIRYLLCFHALGWKSLCNASHEISLQLEGNAYFSCPRVRNFLKCRVWNHTIWKKQSKYCSKPKLFTRKNSFNSRKLLTSRVFVKIDVFWERCKGYYTRLNDKNWHFLNVLKVCLVLRKFGNNSISNEFEKNVKGTIHGFLPKIEVFESLHKIQQFIFFYKTKCFVLTPPHRPPTNPPLNYREKS